MNGELCRGMEILSVNPSQTDTCSKPIPPLCTTFDRAGILNKGATYVASILERYNNETDYS